MAAVASEKRREKERRLDPQRIYTVGEMARVLGMDEGTLRKRIKENGFPARPINRELRVCGWWAMKWLDSLLKGEAS